MDREKHRHLHRIGKQSFTKSLFDSRCPTKKCTPRFARGAPKYTVSEDATKTGACKMKYAALQRQTMPKRNWARVERSAYSHVAITAESKGDAPHLSRSSAELDPRTHSRSQERDREERITDVQPPRVQFVETNRSQRRKSYPTVKCEHCSKEFTGMYARGNCARHIRAQHDAPQLDTESTCRICKQRFHREDARRKHEWKKHQLKDVRPRPRPRHKSGQFEPSISGGTRDDEGGSTGGFFNEGYDHGSIFQSDTAAAESPWNHFYPSRYARGPGSTGQAQTAQIQDRLLSPFAPSGPSLFDFDFQNPYVPPELRIPGHKVSGEGATTMLNHHNI